LAATPRTVAEASGLGAGVDDLRAVSGPVHDGVGQPRAGETFGHSPNVVGSSRHHVVMTATRGLHGHQWKHRYTSSTDDLIADFYAPALSESRLYDRAAGFFRSTVYLLAGSETAAFALRGGRARIVCSPSLSHEDIDAISRGVDPQSVADASLLGELEAVLKEPESHAPVELLAALLATGALEMRFALRNGGMFHDKVGLFSDAGNDRISFAGSINETWRAWSPYGNHEHFEVFTSWGDDGVRVAEHVRFFEDLWLGGLPGITVLGAPQALLERVLDRGPADPEGHLESVARQPTRRPHPHAAGRNGKPVLFPHQAAAVANWFARDSRGILKHATGSGKTVTGLAIAEQWIRNGGSALVLVPSVLLLEQWEYEVGNVLSDLDPSVLLIGGGNEDWRRRGLLRLYTRKSGQPCITVATMQTAASDMFLRTIDGGPHLLVIADEVHRLGSPQNQAMFSLDAGGRLGLSATPERFGDPGGTAAIMDYFGGVLDPEFGIEDAIEAGRLTPYEYFVHVVRLSEEEVDDWEALSLRIRQMAARYKDGQSGPLPDDLKFLLIRRARIAKRATSKAPRAARVVREHYTPGQRWLVYCEDRIQLAAVRQELGAVGLRSFEYHSAMQGDRIETLQRFERDGGILVAIRCLDEGVDIPAVSHALILASSRNPREFVQRRGRVLRRFPDKHFAVIHDLLVEPPSPTPGDALAIGELARALEFARHAKNRAALGELERLCMEWGVDPGWLSPDGVEDDVLDIDDGMTND
jgi:superfamily II DNA or RNA helicase